jgi:hypothetical protein
LFLPTLLLTNISATWLVWTTGKISG